MSGRRCVSVCVVSARSAALVAATGVECCGSNDSASGIAAANWCRLLWVVPYPGNERGCCFGLFREGRVFRAWRLGGVYLLILVLGGVGAIGIFGGT